jgi:uncharacterized protein
MNRTETMRLLALLITLIAIPPSAPIADYPIAPVPLKDVRITNGFWVSKLETNRAVSIPHIMRQNEVTGRVDNFLKAARKAGDYQGKRYNDTDVYKAVEAAAYSLVNHPDRELDRKLDEAIAIIAAAQEPDGYLFTSRTADPRSPPPGAGPERWSWLHTSHELYNMGHLIEAAVAHHYATGKRTLLDVAIRAADLLVKEFGPGKRQDVPGHQEVELALVKLYRVTNTAAYRDLAKFFLDERGTPHAAKPHAFDPKDPFSIYNDLAYRQDHLPVARQTRATGHAVRATYMYSGMTDVATLAGAAPLAKTVEAAFRDITGKRMYVTGGLGSEAGTEAFGDDYALPNKAYAETCASIGGMLWYHRMFLRTGGSDYMDVFERTLYNGYLSGVSLSGNQFFYENPLVSDGKPGRPNERTEYFEVACCPGNLARLMEQLPGLIYAQGSSELFVNLFVGSEAKLKIGGVLVTVKQTTNYPWEGAVAIRIDASKPVDAELAIRIPGWARGQAMPSDLYRFASLEWRGPLHPAKLTPLRSPSAARSAPFAPDSEHVTLSINGQDVPLAVRGGYARIRRQWQRGDLVEVQLPMTVRRVLAHDRVKENAGKAAIQRGPVVYAIEAADNGGKVSNVRLPLDAPLTSQFRSDLLGGVHVVRGLNVIAIPYFAWANRGPGEMAVWVPY